MKIVILHCHYERGGVTQVVENHVRSLLDCSHVDQIVLACGDRASGLSAHTLAAVEQLSIAGFDYDLQEFSGNSLSGRAQAMVRDLEAELANHGIAKDNSVLHWHNHSLGKNTAAPAAIRLLAESGWRILLQIHDFAEDSRPENYRRLLQATGAESKSEIDQYLYPVGSQIHYATLTRADAAVLCEVGIPETRTHCLPNSVVLPSAAQPPQDESLAKLRQSIGLPDDARWCLYPVRGIRRKNVGEFVLLSRWIRPDQFAGLTLCPTTPVEKRSYERWREVAAQIAPKAVFDVGQHPDVTFADNVSAADFIMSTSVAEGFGMSFLEPWLAHREVIARRLPTVTDDFESSGVKLSKFYDQILIPGDAAWIRECNAESIAAIREAWSNLPEQFQPSLDSQANESTDRIDFAKLTSNRQIEVLRKAAEDPGFESDVKECSRELVAHLTGQPDVALVEHNAGVVGREYSPERSGQRLIAIYDQLLSTGCDSEIGSPSHSGIAVDLITQTRPFFPCRIEVIDD